MKFICLHQAEAWGLFGQGQGSSDCLIEPLKTTPSNVLNCERDKYNSWSQSAHISSYNELSYILSPARRRFPAQVAPLRTSLAASKHSHQITQILTKTAYPDFRRLSRQQHPSLLLPRRLPASLRRHLALARHSPQRPHLRHLDRSQLHHQTVRRIPH